MPPTSTMRSEVERVIDRALDDFGRYLRYRWWMVLLAALALWWLIAEVAPAIHAHGPQSGAALLSVVDVLLAIVLGGALALALLWFLVRPRMTWALPGNVPVSFKDYKGNPEVIEAAQRIVTLLRGVKDLKAMGGEISQGLLLVGPQGVGKSYLAQCISTEAGVPFAYANAASVRAMPLGLETLAIKLLYRKARRLAREYGGCIIFMDEFDTIGMTRGAAGASGAPQSGATGAAGATGHAGALTELLLQLDTPPLIEHWSHRALHTLGFHSGRAQHEPVLTICATATPDALDPALLRPGRFDRKIVIAPPSDAHRGEVIAYYLSTVPHEDIAMPKLVADMTGYTPVAIKHVINEAVVIAHGDGRDSITYRDIAVARETHEYGIRYPRALSALEKRRLAYHEAGHAIAQVYLLPRYRVAHATIAKRLGAQGEAFVAAKPLEEIVTQSAEEVLACIEVALASRAAEELFLQTRLSGVGADLANATQLALQYVAHWGMGDSFFSAAATLAPERMYTDPTLRGQAERLLRQAYNEVRTLLKQHRYAVVAVAEALLQREELASDEIEQLIREAERAANGQMAALANVAESALADTSAAQPEPASSGAAPNEPQPHRATPVVSAPLAPVAFAASPSQELRGDRIVDRALLRAPRLTTPLTDPNLPIVNASNGGTTSAD